LALLVVLVAWAFLANADTAKELPISHYYDNFVIEKYFPFVKQNSVACSCIAFAKEWLGIDTPLGNARFIQPTRTEPYVGGMVITKEGGGHVAIILDIQDDELFIVEGNYYHCQVSYRILNRYDDMVRGDRKSVV
jgi:hypothetical protein